MMRVLHICAAMNDGGVERMIMNYFSVMNREAVQFDFVVHSAKEGMLESVAESMGAVIYHVPPKTKNPFLYIKRMTEIMRAGNYDVVHCHQGNKSLYPLMIAKRVGIPKRIAHAHSDIPVGGIIDKLIKRVETCLTEEYATILLACSEKAGADMWNARSYRIIHDAVDIKRFAFSAEKRDRLRKDLDVVDKTVIVCVARMVESKNHKRLIEIVAKMQQKDPQIALLLVGSGGLQDAIHKQVDSLHVKNVIFAGSSENVEDYLCASDIFVLPTMHEGFGMAIMEAQLSGLETVTTDVVSQELYLTSKLHTLSLTDTDDEWINAIYSNLNGDRSVEIGSDVSEYDIRIQGERLMELYCQKN